MLGHQPPEPNMTTPNPDTLCPGCFADKGRTNPCPHCGYDCRRRRETGANLPT